MVGCIVVEVGCIVVGLGIVAVGLGTVAVGLELGRIVAEAEELLVEVGFVTGVGIGRAVVGIGQAGVVRLAVVVRTLMDQWKSSWIFWKVFLGLPPIGLGLCASSSGRVKENRPKKLLWCQ